MNDIKDILNKMKFVPENMQDEVLKNIKNKVEEEINKSCNPINLVIERLEELEFGYSEEDTEKDRKIIRIIASCLNFEWYDMKPIYCESIEKTKEYPTWTNKWKVNEQYNKFIKDTIEGNENEKDYITYVITQIAQESHNKNIDVINDSYWIYRDGANWDIWLCTTKQLANEMKSLFRECFVSRDENDIKTCYEILNKLEKSFPKKE